MAIDHPNVNLVLNLFQYSILILIPFVLIFAITTYISNKFTNRLTSLFSYIIIIYYPIAYTIYSMIPMVEFNRVFGPIKAAIMIVFVVMFTVFMWAEGTNNKPMLIAFTLVIYLVGAVGVPMIWVK